MNHKRIAAIAILQVFILIPYFQALSQDLQGLEYNRWNALDELHEELQAAKSAAITGYIFDIVLSIGGALLYADNPAFGTAMVTLGCLDFLTLTLPHQLDGVQKIRWQIRLLKGVKPEYPWWDWDC